MLSTLQLCSLICSGRTFFKVAPTGDILARYTLYGPVFIWRRNQMVELTMQGSNLCWQLVAASESDEEGIHLV